MMRIAFLRLILFGALSAFGALASPDSRADVKWAELTQAMRQSTVKVTSGSCLGAVFQLEGSGVLFTRGDRTYVLTSEHVVLHSNEGICHRVLQPETGFQSRATLKRADWGMGLALLELTSPPSFQTALSLEMGLKWGRRFLTESGGFGLEHGRFIEGYPVDSQRLASHSYDESELDSSLLDGAGPARFHPFARQHYVRARTEFGMSGGPEFSIHGLQGILTAMEPDRSSHLGSIAYAIDSRAAEEWLANVLSGSPRIGLWLPLEVQYEGRERICTQDLEFEALDGRIQVRTLVPGACEGATWAFQDEHGFLNRVRNELQTRGQAKVTVRASERLDHVGELFRILDCKWSDCNQARQSLEID